MNKFDIHKIRRSLQKRELKGCLHGKTPEQKKQFFRSLSEFHRTDPLFWKEQTMDLQPHELKEYANFVMEENRNMQTLSFMINLLDSLLDYE